MNKLNEFVEKLLNNMAPSDHHAEDTPVISRYSLMKILREFKQENNNGWISVEDDTPKDDKRVLCWCEDDYDETYLIGWYDSASKYWSLDYDGAKDYKVVAWQPLPEKYKPEK